MPLLLLGELLLPGLRLHLLHLDGVGLSPAHVELVVAHTQGKDALVDAQPRGEKYKIWGLLINRFDDEFAIVERNVANFGPRETNLWCQSEQRKKLHKVRIKIIIITNW